MIKIKLSRVLGDQRMTQAELARKTQIRTATINDLYHDFAERVSLTQLSNICYVLNCDLTDILEYTRDKELILEEKRPRKKKKKKTTQPKAEEKTEEPTEKSTPETTEKLAENIPEETENPTE